jgi:replication initiation protein RepC
MAEERAPGAPRESLVQGPTGFRRLTPGLLRAERAAESFAGLPKGVAAPAHLLAAFKAAAPRLGVAPRLVHALDWLFRFTQPQDWEEGRRPIVWPSALMQQEALGLSATQVKEINRRLIELGLVAMRDSPNGKRYGTRNPKGHIVEAYGFDLSPIAVRHGEFVRLAAEGRAERALMGRLRRRATIARKGIVQVLETAAEYGFLGEEWQALARDMAALTRALKGIEHPEEMEAGVRSLEGRQAAARERLESLLKPVDSTPRPAENRPHQHNFKALPDPEQDTVITTKDCSAAGQGPLSSIPASEPQHRPETGRRHGLAADELVRLAPRLRPYLEHSSPSWSQLVDAADWLRHDLGISKSLWGEACAAMGREMAALAMAVVSTKAPEHFRTSPGGYFHGMVEKARAGELHLERTVWALRQAVDPDRDRRRSEGREHFSRDRNHQR